MHMANSSSSVVPFLGRILISVIFIVAGIQKIVGFSMFTGYVAASRLPLPKVSLAIAIAIELLGGLAILAGLYTRFTAWIIFLYLIPTTLLFHDFWAYQGAARIESQINFEKNLAIMGGLLFVATFGAGAFSFDAARTPQSA
jgi:putative oxidoreductase